MQNIWEYTGYKPLASKEQQNYCNDKEDILLSKFIFSFLEMSDKLPSLLSTTRDGQ